MNVCKKVNIYESLQIIEIWQLTERVSRKKKLISFKK